MDADTQQRAEYEQDMKQLERAATEALVASKSRPLTDDEIMLVAWSAGLIDNVYREIRQ